MDSHIENAEFPLEIWKKKLSPMTVISANKSIKIKVNNF
jgi:hypothetical protein